MKKSTVVKIIVIGLAMAAFLALGYAQMDAAQRAGYACWYAKKGESAEKAITQLRSVAANSMWAKVTEVEGRVTFVYDFLGLEISSCTITHKDGRVLEGSRRSPS